MGLGLAPVHPVQTDNRSEPRSRTQVTGLLSLGPPLPVSRMQVLAPMIIRSRPHHKDLLPSPPPSQEGVLKPLGRENILYQGGAARPTQPSSANEHPSSPSSGSGLRSDSCLSVLAEEAEARRWDLSPAERPPRPGRTPPGGHRQARAPSGGCLWSSSGAWLQTLGVWFSRDRVSQACTLPGTALRAQEHQQ